MERDNMMTRKDYVKAIELMKGKSVEDYSLIANYLIEFFAQDNPRFDIEKFARETMMKCHPNDGNNMVDQDLWEHCNIPTVSELIDSIHASK